MSRQSPKFLGLLRHFAGATGGNVAIIFGIVLVPLITFVGAVSLRNIAEPVDLYQIELNPVSSIAVDPVCAMKVPTTGPSTRDRSCHGRRRTGRRPRPPRPSPRS